MTPRYLAWFVHGMGTPAIVILLKLNVVFLLNIIATVLLVLMSSLQF